jgi:hypothetical protein
MSFHQAKKFKVQTGYFDGHERTLSSQVDHREFKGHLRHLRTSAADLRGICE